MSARYAEFQQRISEMLQDADGYFALSDNRRRLMRLQEIYLYLHALGYCILFLVLLLKDIEWPLTFGTLLIGVALAYLHLLRYRDTERQYYAFRKRAYDLTNTAEVMQHNLDEVIASN